MTTSATRVIDSSNAQEISIECRGLTLKALTYGDKSQPPLIAVHGWMDNAASFATLAPLLNQFYVIALELPGHGRSDHRPFGASYFHADYAVDVVHAANGLGFDSFALMGHSMGGGVATLVAAAVPERIECLILLDGIGPYTGDVSDTAHYLGKAIKQSLRPVPPPRRYGSFDELLARRAGATGDIEKEALALIVRRNAEEKTDGDETWWQWTTDPRLKLASPTRLTSDAVRHVLGEIRAPVLSVVASTGIMSQHPEFEKRKAWIHQAQTITVDGHHHFHLDGGADTTAKLISEFVASIDA